MSGVALASATALVLVAARAAAGDPPGAAGSSASSSGTTAGAQADSSGTLFSSLRQAFSEDFKREVVRGHFDVESQSGTHRFYCLVDAKTGKPQANGVAGDPYVRPDGMTGINNGAVAPVSCAKAEQEGTLVTSGYVLKVKLQTVTPRASSTAAPEPVPVAPSAVPAAPSPSPPSPAAAGTAQGPDRIDVAGVRLGMSPDQVRAALKSRMLADYLESTETLGNVDSSEPARVAAAGRYVNVIAAWTPTAAAVAGATGGDGESYEVMFTPVPGKERVMAIVHSVAYAPSRAIHTSALQGGLIAKYGGYRDAGALTDSPTWRLQGDGTMTGGDACGRRAIFGGLGAVGPHTPVPHNLALKTTPEEFRYQLEHCGLAIVTEDQTDAAGNSSMQERSVAQFTVTAYSPSIAFDGATAAAQLMQASAGSSGRSRASSGGPLTPNL